MNNCMTFPETLEEFLEQYQFKDTEEIYTNGSMLIPVFRVKQWAEHCAANVVEVVRCRDCLHYEMGVCLKIYDDGAVNKDAWQERKPDDFCSYGKKREES